MKTLIKQFLDAFKINKSSNWQDNFLVIADFLQENSLDNQADILRLLANNIKKVNSRGVFNNNIITTKYHHFTVLRSRKPLQ